MDCVLEDTPLQYHSSHLWCTLKTWQQIQHTVIQSLTMEMIWMLLLAVGHSLLIQKLRQPPSQLQVTVTLVATVTQLQVMVTIVAFNVLILMCKQEKALFISIQHVLSENWLLDVASWGFQMSVLRKLCICISYSSLWSWFLAWIANHWLCSLWK